MFSPLGQLEEARDIAHEASEQDLIVAGRSQLEASTRLHVFSYCCAAAWSPREFLR